MEVRILPQEEWDRLEGTELGPVRHNLPLDTDVYVVEEDGKIIGTWSTFFLMHLEGFWIDPEHRKKAGVGRALMRIMKAKVKERGANVLLTGAITEDVERLIRKKKGVEIPVKMFAINVEEF